MVIGTYILTKDIKLPTDYDGKVQLKEGVYSLRKDTRNKMFATTLLNGCSTRCYISEYMFNKYFKKGEL